MEKSEIIDQIRKQVEPILEERQLCLIEIKKFYQAGSLFLKMLIDKTEGGITLEECAEINKAISIIFDEKDILGERFILEVSSPGLDRPLVTKNDFLRCMNREVRFFLNEAINAKVELSGIIVRVDKDAVYANVKGEILEIPLAKINKAQQIVD